MYASIIRQWAAATTFRPGKIERERMLVIFRILLKWCLRGQSENANEAFQGETQWWDRPISVLDVLAERRFAKRETAVRLDRFRFTTFL